MMSNNHVGLDKSSLFVTTRITFKHYLVGAVKKTCSGPLQGYLLITSRVFLIINKSNFNILMYSDYLQRLATLDRYLNKMLSVVPKMDSLTAN